jgi:hypothetical protein
MEKKLGIDITCNYCVPWAKGCRMCKISSQIVQPAKAYQKKKKKERKEKQNKSILVKYILLRPLRAPTLSQLFILL